MYPNIFVNPCQVSLGDDLPSSLTDGVVLCHIANHVSPRAVSSIHVPSPAVVSCLIFSFYLFIIYLISAKTVLNQMQTKCGQFSRGLQENWCQRGKKMIIKDYVR